MKILIRETAQCRLREHFHTSVADDLMYMSYLHEPNERAPTRVTRGLYKTDDPYTKNRFNPLAGGDRFIRKKLPPSTPENLVQLDKIVLHTFQKEAIGNKQWLLGCIAAFRALSGESYRSGGRHTSDGITILRGRRTVGGWIRPNLPCGVKVELKGDKMYDFLGTLTEFVLPRLRDFNGFQMEGQSKTAKRQVRVFICKLVCHLLTLFYSPQSQVS